MSTQQACRSDEMIISNVQAVLLAAGASSRYGDDKLLAELIINGTKQSVICHTLTNWLAVFDNIIVMVRRGHIQLQNHLEGRFDKGKIQLVVADDADLGMGHSIAAGVNKSSDSEGWIIGLADMPLIPSSVIQSVCSALMKGALIAVPVREQRRGHPVGFARRYEEQLLALKGDTGAKAVITENRADVTQIPSTTDSIFYDIDKPSDLVNAPQFIADY